MCHAHMCVVLSHLAHHPGFCEFLLSMYLTTATATLNLSVDFFRERETCLNVTLSLTLRQSFRETLVASFS